MSCHVTYVMLSYYNVAQNLRSLHMLLFMVSSHLVGSKPLILTPVFHSILARVNGRSQIDIKDVAECEELFLDARRSANLLSGESGRGFIS